MTRRILIAIPRGDQTDVVKEILEENLQDPNDKLVIHSENNESDAKNLLDDLQVSYDLLIATLHLPLDRKTPLNEKEQRGLGLFKWAAEKHPAVSGILLSETEEVEIYRAIQDIPTCKMIPLSSEDWDGKLLEYATDSLTPGKESAKTQKNLGEVTIALDQEKEIWTYSLEETNGPFNVTSHLNIGAPNWESLSEDSEDVGYLPEHRWEKKFKRIGDELEKIIIKGNPEFAKNLHMLVDKVGGRGKIRIKFLVKKEIFNVALEAFLAESDDKYWLDFAPVYRKLSETAINKYIPFESPTTEPLNCLLIDADLGGNTEQAGDLKKPNGSPLLLPHLTNVANEINSLELFLEKEKEKDGEYPIGDIQVLRREPDEKNFLERVKNALESKDWHLVHYGGHSFYDEMEGKGYVFFRGEYIDYVRIEDFADWLRSTHFVFLSSCHSSEKSFVFELASSQVPAILGFRWDIPDALAREYAEIFYQELFAEKCFDRAFYLAGKQMKEDHKNEKIWAAPILVLQKR